MNLDIVLQFLIFGFRDIDTSILCNADANSQLTISRKENAEEVEISIMMSWAGLKSFMMNI